MILNQTFAAIQGNVGRRLVTLSTQLSVEGVVAFLGHDPRSKHWKRLPSDLEQLYRQLQRSTAPQRLHSLKHYIRSRLGPHSVALGAFPAISIGVQQHLRVREIDPEGAPGSVLASLDLSNRNRRIIIDGVARISAAVDLNELRYDKALTPEEQRELGEILDSLTFPVTIYAPAPGQPALSDDELGQLFADFNFRVSPVPDHIAIALDRSDLYIRATERLATASRALAEGGVIKRAASVGKHATGLVAQQTLLRFVRGACEGERLQDSNHAEAATGNLTIENLEDNVEKLAEFIDTFADEMGEAFAVRNSIHLSSPGWQAIGIIFHDVVYRMHGTDRIKVARALGRIDWGRGNAMWSGIMANKTNASGHTELVMNASGVIAKRQIIEALRRQLGIDRILDQEKTAA
jgi:hypothetical protein